MSERKYFIEATIRAVIVIAFLALYLALAKMAWADTITIREDGTAKTTNCSRGPLGDVACW